MSKKIIKYSLWTVFFALILYLLVTIIIAKVKNSPPVVFGYSFNVVVTNSMEPKIMVNDFVLAKKVDKSKIKVGDDIVFFDPNRIIGNKKGATIIHRVVEIKGEGANRKFVTKGINPLLKNEKPDTFQPSEVIGVYVWSSAFVGVIFRNAIYAIIVGILLYFCIKLTIRTVKIAKTKETD